MLLTLAAAAYMDALGARLPPGGRRLAAALPVLAAFLTAPLLYDRDTEPASTVVAINFPWLSNLTVSQAALCSSILSGKPVLPAMRAWRPSAGRALPVCCLLSFRDSLCLVPCQVVSWAMGRGALAQTRPLAGTFAFLLAGAAIPADATSARPGCATRAPRPVPSACISSRALRQRPPKLHAEGHDRRISALVTVRLHAILLIVALQSGAAAGAPFQPLARRLQARAAPGRRLRLRVLAPAGSDLQRAAV